MVMAGVTWKPMYFVKQWGKDMQGVLPAIMQSHDMFLPCYPMSFAREMRLLSTSALLEIILFANLSLELVLFAIRKQVCKPFPKRQILHSSKLKEFADNNFKFDENGREFSKRVENTMGKGEIACNEKFLLSPQ